MQSLVLKISNPDTVHAIAETAKRLGTTPEQAALELRAVGRVDRVAGNLEWLCPADRALTVGADEKENCSLADLITCTRISLSIAGPSTPCRRKRT